MLRASMESLHIASRFCGPPDTANGGYLAGSLAGRLGAPGPVEVTLLAPCPVDTDLSLSREDGAVVAAGPDGPVARARPAELDLEPCAAPDPAAVARVAGQSRAMQTHPFPGCFVCGPEREDGLGVFAGPVGPLAAASWTPAPEWADRDGRVRPELLWAALDCPSIFPLLEDAEWAARLEPMVLGRMTASIERALAVERPAVIAAWTVSAEGRKVLGAAAIFDAGGVVVARALCTWISIAGR